MLSVIRENRLRSSALRGHDVALQNSVALILTTAEENFGAVGRPTRIERVKRRACELDKVGTIPICSPKNSLRV